MIKDLWFIFYYCYIILLFSHAIEYKLCDYASSHWIPSNQKIAFVLKTATESSPI